MKKYSLILLFLLYGVSLNAQANPYILGIKLSSGTCDVSDAFTGNDNDDLPTYSADWTYTSGETTAFEILSNTAANNNPSISDTFAYNDACAFTGNHQVTVTVNNTTNNNYSGPSVRCQTSGHNMYGFESDAGDGLYFFKYVAGSYTQFGAKDAVWSATDVALLSANGTTITAKVNGTDHSASPVTDSSHTGGFPGMQAAGTFGDCRLDDWNGTDI